MPKQRPLSQLFRDLIEAERDQMAQCAAGSASGYEEAQKRRERLRISSARPSKPRSTPSAASAPTPPSTSCETCEGSRRT